MARHRTIKKKNLVVRRMIRCNFNNKEQRPMTIAIDKYETKLSCLGSNFISAVDIS